MRRDLLAALVLLAASTLDAPSPPPEPKRRRSDEDPPKPLYNQSGSVTASTASAPAWDDPQWYRQHARPSDDPAAEQIRAERAKRKAEAWAKRNPKNNA